MRAMISLLLVSTSVLANDWYMNDADKYMPNYLPPPQYTSEQIHMRGLQQQYLREQSELAKAQREELQRQQYERMMPRPRIDWNR
jgi:hypothetical protein